MVDELDKTDFSCGICWLPSNAAFVFFIVVDAVGASVEAVQSIAEVLHMFLSRAVPS